MLNLLAYRVLTKIEFAQTLLDQSLLLALSADRQ